MDWLCCFKGDSRYSEIEGEASFRVHTVQSVVPPPCYSSSEFYDAEPTMQRGIWYLTCSPKDDEVVRAALVPSVENVSERARRGNASHVRLQ